MTEKKGSWGWVLVAGDLGLDQPIWDDYSLQENSSPPRRRRGRGWWAPDQERRPTTPAPSLTKEGNYLAHFHARWGALETGRAMTSRQMTEGRRIQNSPFTIHNSLFTIALGCP